MTARRGVWRRGRHGRGRHRPYRAPAALIAAFNRAGWEAFRDTRSRRDDVYTETGTGRRVSGADAYVGLCQGWKAALPRDAQLDRVWRRGRAGDGLV